MIEQDKMALDNELNELKEMAEVKPLANPYIEDR